MKYVPASTNPKDAQWIEGRKLTREEVTSAYHIPLTLVGILDHATYSNISEQHKMLYQDTLGPTLQMIQQELALQLFPDFAGVEDMYLEFNIAEKLRGNFEEQAQQMQTSVGGPWMTRNEARARVNLPQIPDGDQLINPLNLGAVTSEEAKLPLITRDQAATLGELVRAGVDPTDAARLVGIASSITVVEGVPVTLRTPDELAAGTRRN
jgi:phage portal protein BeeE